MTRISSRRVSQSRRQVVAQVAEHALADLLASRPLRDHRLVRQCAIGPYVLDYVYSEKALVVELRAAEREEERAREAARHAFLAAMGYTVLSVSPAELLLRPTVVLARLRSALSRA